MDSGSLYIYISSDRRSDLVATSKYIDLHTVFMLVLIK